MSPFRASALLLTYNQEAFVKEALESLFNQDYENLEIIVSDDASTDNTWRVIEEIAKARNGKGKLVLHRNPQNLGLTANYEAAFKLATGDLIFSAAGDDISATDRCSACIKLWMQNDCLPDLVATDAYDMDVQGDVLGVKCMDEIQTFSLETWAVKRPYQFGASHMLTRRLLALNPLAPGLPAEDQCFVVRALMMGGGLRLSAPKVYHRRSGMSGKAREKSFEEKIMNMRRGASRGLIELEQMQRDAACLGQASRFLALTQGQHGLYQYILAQLEPKSLAESWALLRKTQYVPVMKKVRIFLYAIFPRLFSGLFGLKATLNG